MKNCLNHYSGGLGAYSALASAFLLLAGSDAEAQVLHTPVNLTLTDGAFEIDFDSDGVADVNILQTTFSSLYSAPAAVGIDGGFNEIVGTGSGYFIPFLYPSALPYGALIGPGGLTPNLNVGTFNPSFGIASLNFNDAFGLWTNPTDAYVGMTFRAGSGEDHYAWIRLNVPDAFSVEIIGYAYESQPDVAIAAGDIDISAPTGLTATVLGPNSVTLSWDALADADKYLLQGRPLGSTGPWGTVITSTNSRTFSTLPTGGTFEWRVKYRRTDGVISAFSVTSQFTLPSSREGKKEQVVKVRQHLLKE